MKVKNKVRKVFDVIQALRIHRQLIKNASLTRAQLQLKKYNQLYEILDYAKKYSPFYEKLYASVDIQSQDFSLKELPILTKSMMMDQLDEIFTVRKLKKNDLIEKVQNFTQDPYYLDQYRVVSSTGSSGRKGICIFDRLEWSYALALTIRWMNALGVSFKFPPQRLKVASIGASDPVHLSYSLVQSLDFGLHDVLRLEASSEPHQIINQLNRFNPRIIHSYPSILSLIASDSKLKINPKVICTSSELCTDWMEARIKERWPQAQLFNCYGMLEVVINGLSCSENEGIHLLDDHYILENVDSENNPVPDGEMGDKILITNLFNKTQPLIRYEISDKIQLSTSRCSCGSSYPLVKSIGGKSEDILYLQNQNLKWTPVHWSFFKNILLKDSSILEFQMIQTREKISIYLVSKDNYLKDKIKKDFSDEIRSRNLLVPQLDIKIVSKIKRPQEKMGKLKVIINRFQPDSVNA